MIRTTYKNLLIIIGIVVVISIPLGLLISWGAEAKNVQEYLMGTGILTGVCLLVSLLAWFAGRIYYVKQLNSIPKNEVEALVERQFVAEYVRSDDDIKVTHKIIINSREVKEIKNGIESITDWKTIYYVVASDNQFYMYRRIFKSPIIVPQIAFNTESEYKQFIKATRLFQAVSHL